MPQFFRKRPLAFLIILVILLIALAIFTSSHSNKLTVIEGVVGEVVTPIQGVMYRTATIVSDYFQSIGERRQLVGDYETLKDRVAQLEQQQLEMDEKVRENERLTALLGFKKEHEEFILTGVRITGKNPGNWFNVITINKGTNQGIKVNMAVVNDKGLIGRVIDVGGNWSKVRAIIDGQSSVSGIIERTRDNGTVKGNNSITFENGLCRMIHLPLDSDIVIGDKVITSGLGEIFPKGIYIGEVVEVIYEKRDLFKTAMIQPGADFLRLEEVLVISSQNE